jgi:hypothetical protein
MTMEQLSKGFLNGGKMQKGAYEFISKYVDIDFGQIVFDNKDADFIEVKWEADDGMRGAVIVTDKGARRLDDAGLGKPRELLKVSVDAGGKCRSGMRHGSVVRLIRDPSIFKNTLAELRRRENAAEHKVLVTPIE